MPTMDASQPAPKNSNDSELMIAKVRDDLAALVFPSHVSDELLAFLVAVEVRKLWARPIKTFIPVLALRAARERLDALYAVHQVTVAPINATATGASAPIWAPLSATTRCISTMGCREGYATMRRSLIRHVAKRAMRRSGCSLPALLRRR